MIKAGRIVDHIVEADLYRLLDGLLDDDPLRGDLLAADDR